jgi:hypothetical protein
MRTPPPQGAANYGTTERVLRLYLWLSKEGRNSTMKDAAGYLGVSEKTIERYMKVINTVTGERLELRVVVQEKPFDWRRYHDKAPKAKKQKFVDFGDLR